MKVENLILFLWFLRLFKPEWILSYYMPGVEFLKSLPILLLYPAFIFVVVSKMDKVIIDKPYLLFFLSAAISTVLACNNGLARIELRSIAESTMFYILSISIMKDGKNTDRLFYMYLAGLAFYGIFGILYKGVVPFHIILNEEDAFGPFMAMGVPLSFYVAFRAKDTKHKIFLITFLCLAGGVASFARGAFISLCVGICYIWWKFPKKIKATMAVALLGAFFTVFASTMFKDNSYWKEMSTITESYKKNEERNYLWKHALKMFADYPVTGVGPNNFGFMQLRFTAPEELMERGVSHGEVYGRAVHNIYVQLLAETGLLGMVCFGFLVYSFWKRNRVVERGYKKLMKGAYLNDEARNNKNSRLRKYYYYSIAVKGALIVYLVNGFFYDILYYHWIADMLILNSLVLYNWEGAVKEARIPDNKT